METTSWQHSVIRRWFWWNSSNRISLSTSSTVK